MKYFLKGGGRKNQNNKDFAEADVKLTHLPPSMPPNWLFQYVSFVLLPIADLSSIYFQTWKKIKWFDDILVFYLWNAKYVFQWS